VDFRDYTSTDIEGSPVCPACVREMFDKALKFEHDYPPKWGAFLHPSEFSHVISKDFIETYQHKEIEYKTQPSRRVYCQHMVERVIVQDSGVWETVQEPCGEFIGVRHRLSKPDVLVLGRCKECKNATCMMCDDYSSDPATTLQHICTGNSSANEQRAQAFVGLKRGREWQQCPNRLCGRRIELSAACNHITCPCGTGFCFICGKEAGDDSTHWARKSGCPRYKHPDDRDAEYDEYDEDDDDSIAPVEIEPSDDDDPLESVRGLFDVDGGSGELAAVLANMAARTEEMVAAIVVRVNGLSTGLVDPGGGGSMPEAVLSPAMEPLPTGDEEQTASPSRQEEMAQETDDSPGGHLLSRILARLQERNETFPPTRHAASDMLEAAPVSATDTEAIANAYLEDDLSDVERDVQELLMNSDGPGVTMEEADIDSTLWRLHVD
jgi:hypothetical protein